MQTVERPVKRIQDSRGSGSDRQMKALVVHPGTQHSFRLAAQLQRFGCLSRFWTGFAYIPNSTLGLGIRSMPRGLGRLLDGRRLTGVPTEKLRTQPLVDLLALRRLRAGHDNQTVMFERNEAFQQGIPEREVADSDVVIGVDTASWLLADQAAALGRPFILDRTIGHPRTFERLIPVLNQQFPEWIEDCPHRLPHLLSAEDTEHSQARLIAVGSSFTRNTLVENGVTPQKIVVVPLGVDLDAFTPAPHPDLSRPVRFVFVGSVGVRKGVPLLLQVWRSLGRVNAEMWLAGPVSKRNARLIPTLSGLRMMGKVGRRELPGLLRQCDVLVFPSYFEGFGAVLLEAMAAGLPIIATDATGAPDLIADGVEGLVVPTGNAEALRDAMRRFIDSRDTLARMSQAARRCAERYSWDSYGERWIDILRQVMSDAHNAEDRSVSARGADLADAGERRADAVEYRSPRENGAPCVRPESSIPNKSGQIKALLVHPGTQYSFRLAAELHRHGCLSRFWTGMAYVPDSRLGRCIRRLPMPVQRQLSNRRLEGVSTNEIRILPLGEWRALRRLRAGHDDQTVMFERNAAFQGRIPQRELANSNVVIGFDTSSWLLAERALALGRTFILDRSIGHPSSFQRLMPMLRQQFPEWLENCLPRLDALVLCETKEHRYAERIVVPSSFVRATLIENGVQADKIVVIPFGVDLELFRPAPHCDVPRPLRFVFVGSLSARKGVPLLVRAWHSLAPKTAELWLVGPVSEQHARLIPVLPGLRLMGKVPHRQLPSLLRECDVLVFPSYFEGLAQVQLEALAAGLPVIGTEASGGGDLITDGVEGYVIPAGDAEALQDAMERFIDAPAELPRMSQAARRRAESFSWEIYGNRWMDLLRQVV